MAHVKLTNAGPGISGLLASFPDSGRALKTLAQTLLRGPSPLSAGERELIATFVSARNNCNFCTKSHAAVARELLGEDCDLVDAALQDSSSKRIGEKLQALLNIAERVRSDARSVSSSDIARAKNAGADDQAIHDTVLIAAAFCMYNRYVEGLGTTSPTDQAAYVPMGKRLANAGYED